MTAPSDSTEAHKNNSTQFYGSFIPHLYSEQIDMIHLAAGGRLETQHFKHENVPILKASREALAVRIWTHFLTFLCVSFLISEMDSHRNCEACGKRERVMLYLH